MLYSSHLNMLFSIDKNIVRIISVRIYLQVGHRALIWQDFMFSSFGYFPNWPLRTPHLLLNTGEKLWWSYTHNSIYRFLCCWSVWRSVLIETQAFTTPGKRAETCLEILLVAPRHKPFTFPKSLGLPHGLVNAISQLFVFLNEKIIKS